MRNLAQRLIEYETRRNKFPQTNPPAIFDVCEKLRPQLATLISNAGFRVILSRALVLAGAEVPWLRALHVKSDGSLEGLDEMEAQLSPEEFLEGRMELLAQLLGLLVAFIGEKLTMGLVQEAWPKVPLDDLDFTKGGKNEKKK